jgi:hypothetical protein
MTRRTELHNLLVSASDYVNHPRESMLCKLSLDRARVVLYGLAIEATNRRLFRCA